MTLTPWRESVLQQGEARRYVVWCRRRDLNPHGLRHTPLKRACLPFHHFGTWQERETPPTRYAEQTVLLFHADTLRFTNDERQSEGAAL